MAKHSGLRGRVGSARAGPQLKRPPSLPAPRRLPPPSPPPKQPAASEQYGGAAALSEPQTRLLKGVVDASPLAAYVNVHSGEWAVYTPWDSKPAYAPDLPVSSWPGPPQAGPCLRCRDRPRGGPARRALPVVGGWEPRLAGRAPSPGASRPQPRAENLPPPGTPPPLRPGGPVQADRAAGHPLRLHRRPGGRGVGLPRFWQLHGLVRAARRREGGARGARRGPYLRWGLNPAVSASACPAKAVLFPACAPPRPTPLLAALPTALTQHLHRRQGALPFDRGGLRQRRRGQAAERCEGAPSPRARQPLRRAPPSERDGRPPPPRRRQEQAP
jgi:hypothetical protein